MKRENPCGEQHKELGRILSGQLGEHLERAEGMSRARVNNPTEKNKLQIIEPSNSHRIWFGPMCTQKIDEAVKGCEEKSENLANAKKREDRKFTGLFITHLSLIINVSASEDDS